MIIHDFFFFQTGNEYNYMQYGEDVWEGISSVSYSNFLLDVVSSRGRVDVLARGSVEGRALGTFVQT